MLFITCRDFKDNKFNFDSNAATQEVFFCDRTDINNYSELGSTSFMDMIKESSCNQILFYIHGFSNLPEEDIFPRTRDLQSMMDEDKKGAIMVIPVIWPCDTDKGIIKDYWDDQRAADQSAFAFSRALSKFVAWQQANNGNCMRPMSILAHSMGNRVLRETLKNWSTYDLPNGVPSIFRNIFMVAADVVNETLDKGNSGGIISESAKNVVVYYAFDDLAMPASKGLNFKSRIASRRLGMTGPEDPDKVSKNVHSFDCSGFNNSYDFPKGHTYFLKDRRGNQGKVFKHIFSILKTGRIKTDNNNEL